jgi:hypothetical protein
VVADSACLACHKLGENGNDGPGPELTEIGARIPRAAIARSLVNPAGIMPTFAPCGSPGASEVTCLPRQQYDDLVKFLASLQ